MGVLASMMWIPAYVPILHHHIHVSIINPTGNYNIELAPMILQTIFPAIAAAVIVNLFRRKPTSDSLYCSRRFVIEGPYYEKVDHSCDSTLCSSDDAGFLCERIQDNDHQNESDHCEYRITGQTHAAHRLPGQ